jgi:hypothetical protein
LTEVAHGWENRHPKGVDIRDGVREPVERKMDALAREFAATHDMNVKEEIERLAREYGKLKEPWGFVAR